MKKQLKVIILLSILALSLFGLVKETGAFSYGGLSIPNMPSIQSGSLTLANPYTTATNSSLFYSQITASQTFRSGLSCYQIPLGFFGTGTIAEYAIPGLDDYFGFFGSSPFGYVYPGVRFYLTGTGIELYNLVNDTAYSAVSSDTPIHSYNFPAMPSHDTVVCTNANFIYDSVDGNLSLHSVRVSLYNKINGQASLVYTLFTSFGASGLPIYKFNAFYGFANGQRGVRYTDNRTMYTGHFQFPLPTQGRIFTYSGSVLNTNQIADFLIGTGAITDLVNTSLPTFFGATSVSNSFDISGGGYGSGVYIPPAVTDYYANCSSFLDVGCYIVGTVAKVSDSITGFFGNFLPDLSFSGEFNSCGSGSFSTGTTVSISQRFANVIAIINPIPPSEGTQICTIFGPKTISYQLLWPTENFFQKYIPGQVPALEIDPHIAYGQTLVDLITIFGMMSLIFYQKSKND